jgi:hypothetical protein
MVWRWLFGGGAFSWQSCFVAGLIIALLNYVRVLVASEQTIKRWRRERKERLKAASMAPDNTDVRIEGFDWIETAEPIFQDIPQRNCIVNQKQTYIIGAAVLLVVLVLWHPPLRGYYYTDTSRLSWMLALIVGGALFMAWNLRGSADE